MKKLAALLLLIATSVAAQTTVLPACVAPGTNNVIGLALQGMTVCVPPMVGPVIASCTISNPNGPSPAGTVVPPATSITDAQGTVWTLSDQAAPGGFYILMNGAIAAGGSAMQIDWDGIHITVLNLANATYLWTGSGWQFESSGPPPPPPPPPPPQPPSPAGTTVPPSAQIVDNGSNVWTLGTQTASGGVVILMNGTQAAGGSAIEILWDGTNITVLNNSSVTYLWTGSGWQRQ